MRTIDGAIRPLSIRIRLSPGAIPILAAVSDAIAVLIASAIAGGTYHAVAFGQLGNTIQFFEVGAIFAASTVVLVKLSDLYTPESVLSRGLPVVPVAVIWVGVVLFLLSVF